MKKLNLLRVPLIEELLGLDIAEHGGNMPKLEKRVNEGLAKAVLMGTVQEGLSPGIVRQMSLTNKNKGKESANNSFSIQRKEIELEMP